MEPLKQNSRILVPRVGIGYDIHPFAKGRKLVLGGVNIPFEMGLLGHSDADVVLHAICDALLGAASLGDIGRHFPNSSRKLKGISSLSLVESVEKLLASEGYSVGNVDVTVLLERPKLQPHIASMQLAISRVLHIGIGDVSVKATTNEGLGYLGRNEGCAAYAIALIYRQS